MVTFVQMYPDRDSDKEQVIFRYADPVSSFRSARTVSYVVE